MSSYKKTNNELLQLLISKVNSLQDELKTIKTDIKIIKKDIMVLNMIKKEPEPQSEPETESWTGWRFM